MKSNKLLAKSITLGLILAMPYGVVSAATYEGGTITGWGGANGGTLQAGDVSNNITVTNDNDPTTSQACQIVNIGATANDTVLTGNSSGTGGRQDVYGTAIGTQVGQNAQVFVRGGNASKLKNNGGVIIIGGTVSGISYDGTVSDMTMDSGTVNVTNGILENSTINGGLINVDTNGKTNTLTLNNANLVVKGIAENTLIAGGNVSLQGGMLNSTEVTNGIVNVVSGTVEDIKLNGDIENNKRPGLNINGGTAKNITALNNVYITINGADVENITIDGGKSGISMTSGNLTDVSLKGVDSTNMASMSVAGGTVNGLKIDSYGTVTIDSGTVTNTTIKENGWQGVKEGAVVSKTTIENGGRQTIYENAKSSDVTVNTGAELVLNQYAAAENVTSDGTIYMRDNSKLTGATTLSENAVIDLGGIVNGLHAEDKLSGREESGNYNIENLVSNGATVNVFTENQQLNIDSLTGNEFVVVTDTLGDGLINIKDNSNENVQVIGTSNATSKFNKNDLAGSLQDLADTVSIGSGNQLDSVLAQESNIIGETTALVDEYGNIIANTVIEKGHIANEGITELANVAFMAWRAENDEMHQRMGELRSSKGEAGIWARMKRGESKYGDMDIKNQYSTYQLGYDEKVGDSNWYIGGAISRTEGKSSFATGSGENQSTGFTVYGTYVADDGQYVDLSAKYARLDNEFDVFGRSGIESTGDYRNNGYAFSAEYGKRIEAGNDFWVEPQVQLTYGHLSSANYTTSRDVRVTQDAMDSVVGRLGFAAGKDIGAGNVYVKASYLYDFDGDTNVKMTDGKNSAVYDQDLGGGWFEVGIGTNINLSETSHLYFDVEKTYGGDIETPWQWNAGVRFDF